MAKSSYGPMNPPQRSSGSDIAEWGRFDVLDHRTMYGALPATAAYAESLAWARPALSLDGPQMRDLFDDVDADDTTPVLEEVEREWEDRSHLAPRRLPAAWRTERLIHTIGLPAADWFVDIECSSSIAAVEAALGPFLASRSIDHLTVADLRGRDRHLTTGIARWVWGQVLDDGSLPLGIRFGSKHGTDFRCWAVWLRATDDGAPRREPFDADPGTEILAPEHNPPLQQACDLFGLKIF